MRVAKLWAALVVSCAMLLALISEQVESSSVASPKNDAATLRELGAGNATKASEDKNVSANATSDSVGENEKKEEKLTITSNTTSNEPVNKTSDESHKKKDDTKEAATDDAYADDYDDDEEKYTGTDDTFKHEKLNTTNTTHIKNTTANNETTIMDSIDFDFLEENPRWVMLGFVVAAAALGVHKGIQKCGQRRRYEEIPTSMVV